MPSNADAWEKAPTATGESRDSVWGKRAQLCLGSRGDASEPRREMRIDQVPNARRKSWAESDESCQCRWYRPGELRRRESDRTANVIADRRVRGTNGPALLDRSAGMRNRTEQNPTPTSVSCFRGGFRRAGLNPSTASRSGKAFIPVGLTVRRAALNPMRSFPGLGRTLQVSRAGNSGKA